MPLLVTCPGCKAALRIREEYAGKTLKCPRCSRVITIAAAEPVPGAEEPHPAPPPLPPEEPGDEEAIREARPRRGAARRDAAPARTRECPHCGERVAVTATRCRYCKARLDEEDEQDRPRRKSSYRPCPRCGARGATRVTWTPWGSFYGPALFTHVRCPECGYAYNGRTGRS